MNNCISYSPRASLAIVGMNVRQMGIWDMIGQQVNIQQKTIVHTPLQKLQDAFINMMAGGHGIVEVNQRLKPDPTLSAAFGRQSCAPVGNQCHLECLPGRKRSPDASGDAGHLSPLWGWLSP